MTARTCQVCGRALPEARRTCCSDQCRNTARRMRRAGLTTDELPRVQRGSDPLCAIEFQVTPVDRLVRDYARRGYRSDWKRLRTIHVEIAVGFPETSLKIQETK